MPLIDIIRSRSIVEINEITPGDKSYRNWALPVLSIPAESNTGTVEFSRPLDTYFLAIEYWGGTGSGAVLGDTIDLEIDIDRNLVDFLEISGKLTANAVTTSNEITVNTATLDNDGLLVPGYYIKLGSASNEEYQILTIKNWDTGVLVLDRNLDNAYNSGTDIYRTISLARGVHVFPSENRTQYGTSKIGASKLPAKWKVKVTYNASDSNGREIHMNLEGLY